MDLAEVNLPVFDEPEHPRFRKYQHEHTKAWSARVARADAYVFVTPEYNFSTPPALLNAIDYLVHEWAYKPVGLRQLRRGVGRPSRRPDEQACW